MTFGHTEYVSSLEPNKKNNESCTPLFSPVPPAIPTRFKSLPLIMPIKNLSSLAGANDADVLGPPIYQCVYLCAGQGHFKILPCSGALLHIS